MNQNESWYYMSKLKTTNGHKIILDETEYKLASQYQWQSKSDGRGGYRPVAHIDGRRISFASIVFKLEKNQVIYHKNGNPFDFRKDQILICNRSELGHFIGSSNRKSTNYKGIHYYEKSNSWVARIIKDGNIITGGHFVSEEDAAIVADYFILKNFGEDAERNHPEVPFKEVEERYNQILNKYGQNSNVKKARSGQGIIRCKNKTSRYIGVSRDKTKWTARIKYDKKQMHLGNFETEIEAAKAYDKKAIELYGETAKANFPSKS